MAVYEKKMRISESVYDDIRLLGGVLGTKSASDTIGVLLSSAKLTRHDFRLGTYNELGVVAMDIDKRAKELGIEKEEK